MADDKGEKPGPGLPGDHPSSPARAKGSSTEWTASDERGPLNEADDADVERVVPAHELDAEGGIDPAREPASATPSEFDEPVHDESSPVEAGAPVSTTSGEGVRRATATGPADDKRSLWPVAAGLVIGALVGAGSAWLVYSQSGNGADTQQTIASLSSRVDALDKRPDPTADVSKLQTNLSDLQGKVAGLETKVGSAAPAKASGQGSGDQAKGQAAAPPADAGLAGKVAGLQTALDQLKTRTAALKAQDAKESGAADKVASLQSGLADAKKTASDAQSALDKLKGEQKQLGDKVAGLTIAIAGALKKADGAEKQAAGAQKTAEGAASSADSVQTQQKKLEGKLGSPALAVVSDSLVQQIDAGQPFARQVDALASLNADPAKVAVLREHAAQGVPSAQALLAKWKPLADTVISVGNKAPNDADFGQRLKHGLFGLVSVRREDGTTGDSLTARVNLIESDLAHDDVDGAYKVWMALPDDAKAKSSAWGALAKTSVEALGAARDLQHTAIDALGAKKS